MFTKILNRRRLFLISFAVLVLSPLVYIGNYAGDSQVHLIYGENAARGAFFEFNPGEKSPGVTSPGYMLFIAALFRMAPDLWVPAIVKAANLLFWYASLLLVFLVARRLLQSTNWALAATVVTGLMPGSVYNSTNGMENGIFGFFVLLWIYLAIRARWFANTEGDWWAPRDELALGLLMGLACWLRPEGFVVAAIAVAYRVIRWSRSRPAFVQSLARAAIFLLPFLVVSGALVAFHFTQTGYLLPAGGVSRILMSNIAPDTYRLGPVFLSTKFIVRLAAYFPLTILWLVGNWLIVTGRAGTKGSSSTTGFLIILFWTFFVLYSTVLGAVHLSRYVIFVMPAFILVAIVGAKWVWEVSHSVRLLPQRLPLSSVLSAGAMIMVAAVAALGSVFLIETELRLRLDSQAALWKSMSAPSQRKGFSDALYEQIGRPERLPVSIALQEVQARYWLDQRFIVRSLDGRVDPNLLDYATRDSVDHIGYLKERGVQFLLSIPNYNRDQNQWSLQRLEALQPGDKISHGGIEFTRLPVDRTVREQGTDQGKRTSRWFAGASGPAVLQFFLETLIRVEPGSNQR